MFVKPSSAFVGCPSVVCSSSGSAKNASIGEVVAVHEEELRVAHRAVVELELDAGNGLG